MGSINFNNFKNNNLSKQNYVYTDFYLDFAREPFQPHVRGATTAEIGRDIKVAYNFNAIKNSLTNLFNTYPGERFLLPDYGSDIRQYIFEPVSETMANFIGRRIKSSIEQWEPRVNIINIEVTAYIEEMEYDIDLKLAIPFLEQNKEFTLSGIINRQGFNF